MSLDLSQPAVLAALIAASAALGAAFFAFIAAIINARVSRQNALLQAIITQRIKRADFRQAWINDLREAFAKMQAAFMEQKLDKEGAEHGLRVLLLMNRNDEDYERLRSTIYILSAKGEESKERVDEARKNFVIISQDILKREWEVVKSEISHLEEEVRTNFDSSEVGGRGQSWMPW
jgi:hypothetical protein